MLPNVPTPLTSVNIMEIETMFNNINVITEVFGYALPLINNNICFFFISCYRSITYI